MNKSMSDQEIVISLKTGDPNGIRQLYTKYQHMIHKFILSNKGSQADAEDIFQETLITVLSKIREDGFALTCKLSSFLYSIARNMWLYKLRKMGTMKIQDTEQLNYIIQEDMIPELEVFEAKHDVIATLFKTISEECQKLLQGFYFDNRPLKELASEMGYTDGSIRIKRMRCIDGLKKLVENHPDYKNLD